MRVAEQVLKLGAMGAAVKALQEALNFRAETRFYPPLATDAVVGPATLHAFEALGWALGFAQSTLDGPGISADAQRLILRPETRSPQQLAQARQRAAKLH